MERDISDIEYILLLDSDIHRVLLFVRTNQVHLSNLFDPDGPVLQAPLSRSAHALLFDLEYLAFQELHLGLEILCHPIATTRNKHVEGHVGGASESRRRDQRSLLTAVPFGPGKPANPRAPFSPVGPWGPGGPGLPTSPLIPLSPFSVLIILDVITAGVPGSPCGPAAPGIPSFPFSNRTERNFLTGG